MRRRVRMGIRAGPVARAGVGAAGAATVATAAAVVATTGLSFSTARGTVELTAVSAGSAVAAGTRSSAAQALHLAARPASSSGTLKRLRQLGQLNSIIAGRPPR